jgi:intracellular sulfur oxidation DsrE/DsrF family protein
MAAARHSHVLMGGNAMVHTKGIAWKVKFLLILGAVAVWAAPVMGAGAWAADDNPMAGLKEAKVAFDITAGEPGRMLLILDTIDETREGFTRQGITPRFVLAFRGPASLLTQTDLSRFKPEDRETAAKVAGKLKQLRGTAGIERMDQCAIAMRGQKVDKAQVSPDVTIVANGWTTLVGYQAKGYAYIAP